MKLAYHTSCSGIIGIIFMSLFSWYGQNFSGLILAIIIDWRVACFHSLHKFTSHNLFSEMVPQEAKVPWESDRLSDLVLVGNLPFNVATPFFLKLVKSLEERCNYYTFGKVSAVFTFQNEVRCIDKI